MSTSLQRESVRSGEKAKKAAHSGCGSLAATEYTWPTKVTLDPIWIWRTQQYVHRSPQRHSADTTLETGQPPKTGKPSSLCISDVRYTNGKSKCTSQLHDPSLW